MRRLPRWVCNVAVAVSAALCAASALRLCEFQPATCRLVGPVRVRAFEQSVSVYNQPEPYGGSIIGIVGDPANPACAGFNVLGLYYRHFRWHDGRTWWTLTVPMLYFVAVTAVLPLAWLRSFVQASRRPTGTCNSCGYDLRATPDRCSVIR